MSLNKLGPATAAAAGGGGGWTPASHANGLVWWASDLSVATTGSDVDSWTDQISGLVATPPSTAPTFVASSLNGLPGIDINAIGRLQISNNTAIENIWSKGSIVYLWCVFQITGAAAFSRILDKGFDVAGTGWRIRHNDVSEFEFEQRSSGNDLILDSDNTFGIAAYTMEMSWNGDMATQPVMRIDNSTEAWASLDTGDNPPDDDSASAMTLGGQVNGTGSMDGILHEIWFAQDPSGAEITNARDYASTRWGTF